MKKKGEKGKKKKTFVKITKLNYANVNDKEFHLYKN